MAEAQVVFPTPPFPPIIIRRFGSLSRRFNEGFITTSKVIDTSTAPNLAPVRRGKKPASIGTLRTLSLSKCSINLEQPRTSDGKSRKVDFKDIRLYNILFIWSRYYILVSVLEEDFGNWDDRNRFRIMQRL